MTIRILLIFLVMNGRGHSRPIFMLISIWQSDSELELHTYFFSNAFSWNIGLWFVRYALPHLKEGSSIINTTSVNAYKGHPTLIPYSSTKGAIVGFTRSLAVSLIDKGIRVNGGSFQSFSLTTFCFSNHKSFL